MPSASSELDEDSGDQSERPSLALVFDQAFPFIGTDRDRRPRPRLPVWVTTDGATGKSKLVSARPMDAPTSAAYTYITVYLRPAVHTVEFRSQVIGNDLTFDLRLVENGR